MTKWGNEILLENGEMNQDTENSKTCIPAGRWVAPMAHGHFSRSGTTNS
jgi:hypothetical protein